MKLKFTILILILMSFCACSSLHDYNQSEINKAREYWVNRTSDNLILSWGPPSYKTKFEDNDEIWSYKRSNGFITWVTNFYINDLGFIYHLNAFSE